MGKFILGQEKKGVFFVTEDGEGRARGGPQHISTPPKADNARRFFGRKGPEREGRVKGRTEGREKGGSFGTESSIKKTYWGGKFFKGEQNP